MKRLPPKFLNQKGQSAIEFITVVVVVFFFLLFYLSFSITLVASEYVDYATFMAARTYKSGNIDLESQKFAAQRVFTSYMNPLQSIIRNPKLTFPSGSGNQTEGVKGDYEVDLFYLPPLFIKAGEMPISGLALSSETKLGRDPSLDECLDFFVNFGNKFNLGIDQTLFINLMDDNGC